MTLFSARFEYQIFHAVATIATQLHRSFDTAFMEILKYLKI